MMKVRTFAERHVLHTDQKHCTYYRSVLILIFFWLQMLLDPMGGIVMTNDGNAILREVSFS